MGPKTITNLFQIVSYPSTGNVENQKKINSLKFWLLCVGRQSSSPPIGSSHFQYFLLSSVSITRI